MDTQTVTFVNTSSENSSFPSSYSPHYIRISDSFMICISVVQIVTGMTAMLTNLIIFAVLIQKKKKMASESLVLANLLIDCLYGMIICCTGGLNISNFFPATQITHAKAQCIITHVPYTFLVSASLLLVLVVGVNRILAVRCPSRYKQVFTSTKVNRYLVIIFSISTSMTLLDLGLCLDDQESELARVWEQTWVASRVGMILLEVVIMFFIYKLIARQFTRSFWTPILAPFTRCFSKSQSPQENGEPNINDNNNQMNGVSGLENNSSSNEKAPPRAANGQRSEEMCEMPAAQSSSANQNSSGIEVVTAPVSTTISSRYRMRQQQLRMQRKKLTLQQQKHHVTTIFFFVSVLYLLVSLPISLVQLYSHFIGKIAANKSTYCWLITETLFSINFIINPYLFSFNNSYIKERLIEGWTRYVKRGSIISQDGNDEVESPEKRMTTPIVNERHVVKLKPLLENSLVGGGGAAPNIQLETVPQAQQA